MNIDLNDPAQFTKARVRDMLAHYADGRPYQLRVTLHGIAYLSDVVGNVQCEDLAFRLGSWTGGEYVGPAAASDDAWVTDIYSVLAKNWPVPTAPYIDEY